MGGHWTPNVPVFPRQWITVGIAQPALDIFEPIIEGPVPEAKRGVDEVCDGLVTGARWALNGPHDGSRGGEVRWLE